MTRSSSNKNSKKQRKEKVKSSTSSDKAGPERMPDGHYIIVNNRKWRATDPMIPEEELAELKHYLSKGRTGVRGVRSGAKSEQDADVQLSRKRTGLAKHGLGERGKPEWWNDTEDGRRERWQNALAQLKKLDNDAT